MAMTDAEFRTDGPHSPELTAAAATRAAEMVRFLNYASAPGSGGLGSPADVYDLLGSITVAVERLPQLLGQLQAFLDAQLASGRIGDDRGRDPVPLAWNAAAHLAGAQARAAEVTAELRAARNAIASLYAKGGTDADPGTP